jgi:hypothetical protein
MDKMQARLDRMPNAIAVRRQSVEHLSTGTELSLIVGM